MPSEMSADEATVIEATKVPITRQMTPKATELLLQEIDCQIL